MDAAAILRNAALGAVSGIAASLVMDGVQAGASAAQKQLSSEDSEGGDDSSGDDSTVKAADRLSEAASGNPVPEDRKQTAGSAVHFGFGALLGAVYGAAGTAFPIVRSGFGLPFGAATWAAADEVLVPAAGLGKGPTEVPASEQASYLGMHLVFGAALEGSLRLMEAGLAQLSDGERHGRAENS